MVELKNINLEKRFKCLGQQTHRHPAMTTEQQALRQTAAQLSRNYSRLHLYWLFFFFESFTIPGSPIWQYLYKMPTRAQMQNATSYKMVSTCLVVWKVVFLTKNKL